MPYKSILTIYNPFSGKKKFFTKRIIKYELDKYQGYKEWLTLSKELDFNAVEWGKFDLVMVVGGDGTVREVAEVLYRNNVQVPIAVIPIGSANFLAFSLGVPWSLRRAVRFALTSGVEKIDAGIVNNKYIFLIGVSVGMDAKMIGLTPRHWKKMYGFFAYIISALRYVFSPEEYSFILQIGGKKIKYNAASIVVLNNGNFFGINMGPQVSMLDGQLNIMAIHTAKFRRLIRIFFKILRKKFDTLDDVTYHLAKAVSIRSTTHVEVEIDGEPFDLKTVTVKVLPKAISIVSKKL